MSQHGSTQDELAREHNQTVSVRVNHVATSILISHMDENGVSDDDYLKQKLKNNRHGTVEFAADHILRLVQITHEIGLNTANMWGNFRCNIFNAARSLGYDRPHEE